MRTGRPPASPSRGDPFFRQIILTVHKCSRHQLPVIRMRKVAERSKFFFCWQDMLLPRVKYARIMSFLPFRCSEWRPGGPPKNQKTRIFLRIKVRKFGFSDGGQTDPSQAAPRVGGAGDVLTGLLPPHSNNQKETEHSSSLPAQ